MGKKKASLFLEGGGANSLQQQEQQPQQNPYMQGTIGYTEWQQQNTNPYQYGTSGWTDWQRERGLSTAPPQQTITQQAATQQAQPQPQAEAPSAINATGGGAGIAAMQQEQLGGVSAAGQPPAGFEAEPQYKVVSLGGQNAPAVVENVKTGQRINVSARSGAPKGVLSFDPGGTAINSRQTKVGDMIFGPKLAEGQEEMLGKGILTPQHAAATTEGQQNLIREIGDSGVKLANKARGQEDQVRKAGELLSLYGVKSLNDIKAAQVPSAKGGTKTVFYTDQGFIPETYGNSNRGEGRTEFRLMVGPNGKVYATSQWADTSNLKDYAPLVMAASLALGPLAAGAASAIGGSIMGAAGITAGTTAATVTQAAVSAGMQGLAQGALAKATGGSFGKGFLTGAVGSGIGSVVKAYNPGAFVSSNATIGNAINKAIAGSLSGAAGAAISGTDVAGSATRGAIAGATSGLLSDYTGDAVGNLVGKYVAGYVAPNTPQAAGGAARPAAPQGSYAAAPAASQGGYAAAPVQQQGLLAEYGQAPQFTVRRGIA